MSQNILATPGYSPRHGSNWNVDGSGRAIMSASCTRAKPSMAEPSKPIPSANAPSSSAGATATDLRAPSTSVNQSRTNLMSRSSNVRSTNSSCLSTTFTLDVPATGSTLDATVAPRYQRRRAGAVSRWLRSGSGRDGLPAAPGRDRPGSGGADQQQRSVIVEGRADVPLEVLAQAAEQVPAAVQVGQRGEAGLQRVEVACLVPCLGDAVGVEEEQVVRLEVQLLAGTREVPQGHQAERGRWRADLDGLDVRHTVSRGDLHGRRVAATEDLPLAGLRVDLRQQRGDELFMLTPAASQARVEPSGQFRERVHLVRDLPVHAQHVGRDFHRAEALAAHVADDHPDAMRGIRDVIQVAADLRLRGRGQVDDVELERPDHVGKWPHDGALGRLGDRDDVGEVLVLALAQGSPGGAHHGDDDDRHD